MKGGMRYFCMLCVLGAGLLQAEWIDLWSGEAPGAARPPAGSETINERGGITGVEVPQYFLYAPAEGKGNGGAVVIFPGGGYGNLAMNHEGHDYGKWLAERGFLGVVVKYRVSGAGQDFGYQFPVPYLDARRAIRTVRAKAEEWGIDPNKIGVMGSSAGGHLASLCATRFADSYEEETGEEIDKLSARPDFVILCYPVISMGDELAHGGSRSRLAGSNPAPELLRKLSTEHAVTAETPPIFLVHTSDDPVDCRNSLRFADACKAVGVPVVLHLFEKGGHGYGLKGPLAWPGLLEEWLGER